MSEATGPTTWQAITALVGLAQAGLTMALGWLWTRISGAETRTDKQFSAVWTAITADRTAAQAARERTLERLADMPTKSDLAGLESRITTMLTHHRRDHGAD
jgi:hypothetical protein